jgi:hypothetical protein
VCGERVYFSDRLSADGKLYHKKCFRCAHCNNMVKLGNYASLEGKLYCKPHFKQLFKSKGNYATGFGGETPVEKWNREHADAAASADSPSSRDSDSEPEKEEEEAPAAAVASPSVVLDVPKAEEPAPSKPAAAPSTEKAAAPSGTLLTWRACVRVRVFRRATPVGREANSAFFVFVFVFAGGDGGEGEPFEEDERTIFVDYMMDTFRRDRRVRKQLLLSSDSDEIYRVLADGVILWCAGHHVSFAASAESYLFLRVSVRLASLATQQIHERARAGHARRSRHQWHPVG